MVSVERVQLGKDTSDLDLIYQALCHKGLGHLPARKLRGACFRSWALCTGPSYE